MPKYEASKHLYNEARREAYGNAYVSDRQERSVRGDRAS